MKIKVLIAMHKPYSIPKDSCYLPVHVGAAGKDTFSIFGWDVQRDDDGVNISEKNPNFCELTGLYWAWKNLDADVIGLVHYRRHLSDCSRAYCKKHPWEDCVVSGAKLENLFSSCDIVVPRKTVYGIETLYSHYSHTHDGRHLDLTRELIGKMCPEYLSDCDKVYRQRGGHMYNMMIAKREVLDQYCQWLFPILFELEKVVDVDGLSSFDARLFGRVSEILFNVWLRHHPEYRVGSLRVLNTDPISWPKKIMSFLRAKFLGKKYGASF